MIVDCSTFQSLATKYFDMTLMSTEKLDLRDALLSHVKNCTACAKLWDEGRQDKKSRELAENLRAMGFGRTRSPEEIEEIKKKNVEAAQVLFDLLGKNSSSHTETTNISPNVEMRTTPNVTSSLACAPNKQIQKKWWQVWKR